MAISDWQRGLHKTNLEKHTIRHIIEIERHFSEKYSNQASEFADDILAIYENEKRVRLDDFKYIYLRYFNNVLSESVEPFAIYFKSIMDSGRENALKQLGFDRQACRRMRREAADDSYLKDSIDEAFSRVKTVGDDVVEELRKKWLATGTSNDVVKTFLLEQEQQARDQGLTRAQMKQKMMDIWHDQRYLVERIVRTETINAYAKSQLQEWFDQGFKQVERIEVNDLKTCDKCRALAQPSNNIYFIEDILQGKLTGGKNDEISSAVYPVSYNSHPNCRGSYRLISSFQSFEDFSKMLENLETNGPQEFHNPQDIRSEDGRSIVQNVPMEYQKQVQQAVNDFGPSYGIRFVPEITDDPDWKSDQLEDLLRLYSLSDAEEHLSILQAENRGKILQYKTKSGNILVSGDAGSVNYVVIPVLRQHSEEVWNSLPDYQKKWIQDRYDEKIKEMGYTLKDQGIQIFGESPFVTPLAKESAKDYFCEAFVNYSADPARLRYMDQPAYDWLRDNVISHEYLGRGGI